MAIRGFIELSPGFDRQKVHEIVEAAHRATSGGRVVLILCDRPVGEPLLAHARDADLVIADSERLSAALLSNGILHMRAEEGLSYLRSLAPDEVKPPSSPVGPRAAKTRPGPHVGRTEA